MPLKLADLQFRSSGQPLNAMRYIFPVFNQSGLEMLIAEIVPRMRVGDGVFLVSGNNDNALDTEWLKASALRLKDVLPSHQFQYTPMYAMTAGLENVKAVRDARIPYIHGVVYDYEPHFPNEPEFSYDRAITLCNVQELAKLMDGSGLRSFLLTTGPPLMREWAMRAVREASEPAEDGKPVQWNYAEFGAEVDNQIIMVQSYLKSSLADFKRAVDKANGQHANFGAGAGPWMPQVTVDTGSTNGVSPKLALEGTRYALSKGHPRMFVWWSPVRVNQLLEFLTLAGRQNL